MSVTDKDIFLLTPIKMPLLNVKFPLIAFFIVIPIFIVSLQFNLFFHLRKYKGFILNLKENYGETINNYIPFGLYEAVLLGYDRFSKIVRIFLIIILFYFPVFVVFTFFLRFSDYQSFLIDTILFTIFIVSNIISVVFFNVLYLENKKNINVNNFFIVMGLILLLSFSFINVDRVISRSLIYIYWVDIFFIIIYSVFIKRFFSKKIFFFFHLLFIYLALLYFSFVMPFFTFFIKNERYLDEIYKILEDIPFLLPTLKIDSKILIHTDTNQIQFLKDLNISKNLLPSNFNNRNFIYGSFTYCIMKNDNFNNAIFYKADLSYANLTEANLGGANLTKARLWGAHLTEADLEEANLTKANLVGANLTKANLEGANLTKVNLDGANLTEADLWGANLTEAYLFEANLTKAKLNKANLTNANLDGANLTGAILLDTNFKCSVFNDTVLDAVIFYKTNLSGVDLKGIVNHKISQKKIDEIYNFWVIKAPKAEGGIRKILNFYREYSTKEAILKLSPIIKPVKCNK